jgi:hypothetical protein
VLSALFFEAIKIGTNVKINITLSLDNIKLSEGKSSRIDVSRFVIRTDENGMAICFDKKFIISLYEEYEVQYTIKSSIF